VREEVPKVLITPPSFYKILFIKIYLKLSLLNKLNKPIFLTHIMLLDNIETFISVDALLRNNGYLDTKRKENISWGHNYVKVGFETEYFEIKFEENKFFVSSPIRNSNYQYTASFVDCESAASYMESKFRDFYGLL
jgi:hypothetical protein